MTRKCNYAIYVYKDMQKNRYSEARLWKKLACAGNNEMYEIKKYKKCKIH